MSNIYALASITAMDLTLHTNSDWRDAIQFFQSDGVTPLDITGIVFHATMRPTVSSSSPIGSPIVTLDMSTTNGLLKNGGNTGILQWNVSAQKMNDITPGTYIMDILAIAEIEVNMNQSPATIEVKQGVTQP